MKNIAILLLGIGFLAACGPGNGSGETSDGWLSDRSPSGGEVRLHSGPDTFPVKVAASLDAHDPDAAVDPDAFENETGTRPIGHPLVARFSSAQLAAFGEQIDVWIEVPLPEIQLAEQAGRTIYGMVRLTGDLPGTDATAMRKWHRALGPLVRTESGLVFLKLGLYVAADKLEAVAVSAPRVAMLFDEGASGRIARFAGGNAFDIPWAIACWDPESEECDPDPASTGMGRKALEETNLSSTWLKQEGWSQGRYRTMTVSEARKIAQDSYDDLIFDGDPDAGDAKVHLAGLIDEDACNEGWGALGCYFWSTGHINYTFDVVGGSEGDGTDLSNAYVHEMMHGVQAAMMPVSYLVRDPDGSRWSWLFEATAEAVAYWNLIGDFERMRQLKRGGVWRTWDAEHPLNSPKEKDPYRAVELFAALDRGSVAYLKPLFEKIEQAESAATSYHAVDRALGQVLGSRLSEYPMALAAQSSNPSLQQRLEQENPLGLAFLSLMTDRVPSLGYPHCAQNAFLSGLPGDEEVSIDFTAVTTPFSSDCCQVESIDHDEHFPGACLKFSVAPGDAASDPGRLAFVVDGGLVHNQAGARQLFAYADESLWLQGGVGSVQVIDLDMERAKKPNASSRLESRVLVEVDESCGASEEDMASCLPTRVVCGERNCLLQMTMGGPDDCWVSVGKCVPNDGCYHWYGGEWVPASFGVCGATENLMHDFQLPGQSVTYEDSLLPAHGRCGPANFCRRIILCAQ